MILRNIDTRFAENPASYTYENLVTCLNPPAAHTNESMSSVTIQRGVKCLTNISSGIDREAKSSQHSTSENRRWEPKLIFRRHCIQPPSCIGTPAGSDSSSVAVVKSCHETLILSQTPTFRCLLLPSLSLLSWLILEWIMRRSYST